MCAITKGKQKLKLDIVPNGKPIGNASKILKDMSLCAPIVLSQAPFCIVNYMMEKDLKNRKVRFTGTNIWLLEMCNDQQKSMASYSFVPRNQASHFTNVVFLV